MEIKSILFFYKFQSLKDCFRLSSCIQCIDIQSYNGMKMITSTIGKKDRFYPNIGIQDKKIKAWAMLKSINIKKTLPAIFSDEMPLTKLLRSSSFPESSQAKNRCCFSREWFETLNWWFCSFIPPDCTKPASYFRISFHLSMGRWWW